MAVKTPPYRKNLADILRAVRKDGFKFRRPMHPEAVQVGGSSYPTLKKGPVRIGIDALPIFPGRHGTLVGMHPMTDGLTVAGIVTDPAYRRKGLATAALQKVKAAADSKKVKLLLEPTPIKSATPKGGKAMNSRQLKKWYGKLGFRSYKEDDPTASVLTSLSARIEFGSAGIKRLLRQKLGVMKRGIYIETPTGSPSLQLTPGASMMMVSKADRPMWKGARRREAYKTESAIDRIYRKKGAVDGDPFFRQQEIFDGKEYAIEKRMKRGFSRIDRQRVEMSQPIGYEAGVPLTGRIARDRWVKKLRDEDLDRRDAKLGRAGAAGAIAGALFPSRKLGLYKRMGIGAVAGTAGVLGVRQATKNSRDAYGERSRGAKRAESVPAAAGLTAAGLLAAKRLGVLKKLKFEGKGQQLFFEKPFHGYNSKRHAKTGGLNDGFRKKYNRENGSNLKRPVTTEPSKLKPGSKAAKRRASFCARMGGMQGPTSKGGELTPKGAALKRWNCSAEVSSIQFAEKKEKKGLNPYVGATASGAISGAGLGFIPTILRRGSTLKGALKAGALGGLASGAIVGGGALIGSRILGQPREDEGSAFTKRAAIGGTIAGAGAGLAGGILLRKTRGGAKLLVGASKNWRPAQWLRKGPVVGSAAIGAVAGAGYGGATGADEGQQVDSFRHLRKDLRKDVKAAAMKLERKSQVGDFKFQKDWRDARRESRSEAAKDVMVGGGALAAGAGVGGGALWAARKFGQNADKAGAAAEQVTETLKGVTKPRFVRSRQWLKKQMSFPTFGKVMKKFRMSSTAEAVELARYDKMAQIRKIAKPTEQLKAVVAKENARQPSWNRGMKNKLRNALDMLALENKQRLTEFYMLRQDLTEEQRNVRNAVVAGTVGVGAATGVAALGLRSLKKADEAMRKRWSSIPVAPAALPAPSTPKKYLTPTMEDKWNAAKARAAMSSQGSGRVIRVGAPQAMARQAEARRIKEVRAVSRAPIADPVAGSRASTKARVAQGRKLQKIASVGNAGVLSRGERLAAAGALAAFRKKFRFEHKFSVRYRDGDGRSAGWKNWAKGETVYDDNMNPTSMGVGTLANSMNRYAQQGWRESRRGANLVRDFREVSSGQKTKKREWEKSYFKDRVAGAVGTAGLIAGTVLYRKGGKFGAPKWAKGWHNTVNKVGSGIKRANQTASGWLDKQMGMESRMDATLRMFEGGYAPFGYQDYYSAPGWDLRDARGKSARVFAPGAKKRMRRPAEWHEKKDNQKKLIAGAGVAAALLAGGGGFMLGKQRALRLGKLAKTNAKFRASKGGFGDPPISGNN